MCGQEPTQDHPAPADDRSSRFIWEPGEFKISDTPARPDETLPQLSFDEWLDRRFGLTREEFVAQGGEVPPGE